MNRIFFVCTLYQLIVVITLKERKFKNEDVDIILCDISVGMDRIAKTLQQNNYFRNVYYVKLYEYTFQQSKIKDFKEVIFLNNTKYVQKTLKRFVDIQLINRKYNEIYFFNYNPFLYCLINNNYRNGVKLIRFEEGILAYNHEQCPSKRLIYADRIRKLIKGNSFSELANEFYCFYPELVLDKNRYKPHKIDSIKISEDGLLDILKKAFNLTEFDTREKKYIYFATACDIDGDVIHEDEIVDSIAEQVGKQNLLIKTHPRDKTNIYQRKGYCVSTANDIPWEIIWVTQKLSGITMLSLLSGSVINCKSIYEGECKAVYLYPLVKGRNQQIDEFCNCSLTPMITQLNSLHAHPLIYVVNSIEEFRQFIKEDNYSQS